MGARAEISFEVRYLSQSILGSALVFWIEGQGSGFLEWPGCCGGGWFFRELAASIPTLAAVLRGGTAGPFCMKVQGL